MATFRTPNKVSNQSFYVFFPHVPSQISGKLYGVIQTNTSIPDICNVFITSLLPEDRLQELGSVNFQNDNKEKKSFWVDIKSHGCDLHVQKLIFDNIQVPSNRITLFLYDASIVKSEILELNPQVTSSQCLVELIKLLKPVSQNTRSNNNFIETDPFWHNSKVCQQFSQRYQQVRALRESKSRLKSLNISLTFFFDLLVGFMIIQLFHQNGGTTQIVEALITSIKVIADRLQDLIEWLMGVPYGLKLNRPLSTVLGKFFLYHLYLWKTYIDIIKPLISIVISVSSTAGYIGLSFQMALLSDLISVASLHCYCFYVYATRLYGIAQHGLRATLRMFGGRKRNPLRSRVDSGEFTWDQLCVGMFIFCALLFLLPTILVYYFVFLMLRLGVLILQGTLKRLIWLMNTFPIYTLLLWLSNSPRIAGDVNFDVVSLPQSTVKLVRVKLALITTLQQTLNPSLRPFPRVEWIKRLKEIVSGQLIYPL